MLEKLLENNKKLAKWLILILSLSIMFNALNVLAIKITPLISNLQLGVNQPDTLNLGIKVVFEIAACYGLFVSSFALPSRSRVIWLVSICGLAYLTYIELFNFGSFRSGGMTLVSLIFLASSYRYFNRQLYLSYGFVFVSAFIVFALFYGTFGVFILRGQFYGVKNLTDALYFAVVTYSTVGFGDIYPLTSSAKLFVISMVVIGLILFTSGITLVAYAINSKIKRMLFSFNKGKTSMTNHIILYGYGILSKILIDRYTKKAEKFIVITGREDNSSDLELLAQNENLLRSPYPGSMDVLHRARANEAKLIVVSFDNDADTIFSILNLQEYFAKSPQRPKVIARIFYEENVSKALKVGADQVIAPHILAAEAIINIEV